MSEPVADLAALVARVRRGDASAYPELVERYGRAIRLAVRRRLPNRLRKEYDSLDFVQEVWAAFLAIDPASADYPRPENLVGFLTRIAENKVIDLVRRRYGTQAFDVTREGPLPDGVGETGVPGREPTPSGWAIAAERWAELTKHLTPGQRRVLEKLRDGYTQAEIADELGLSRSSVDRVVRRLKDLCGLP